jgi:hypothetical protein
VIVDAGPCEGQNDEDYDKSLTISKVYTGQMLRARWDRSGKAGWILGVQPFMQKKVFEMKKISRR